jgi:hypothetical protein
MVLLAIGSVPRLGKQTGDRNADMPLNPNTVQSQFRKIEPPAMMVLL